jgi:hypothetical protein
MSMALRNEARSELERHIDWFVNTGIPQIMSRFKTKEVKNILLQYQNEDDFSFGVAYGAIIFGYGEKFLATLHRNPKQAESLEIQTILANRMREVKAAIFKTD